MSNTENVSITDTCPLCKEYKPKRGLDFHHWDYEENIGVKVCRDCHNHIHRNEDSYPKENDDWLEDAMGNAFERYRKFNGNDFTPEQFYNDLNIPRENSE